MELTGGIQGDRLSVFILSQKIFHWHFYTKWGFSRIVAHAMLLYHIYSQKYPDRYVNIFQQLRLLTFDMISANIQKSNSYQKISPTIDKDNKTYEHNNRILCMYC